MSRVLHLACVALALLSSSCSGPLSGSGALSLVPNGGTVRYLVGPMGCKDCEPPVTFSPALGWSADVVPPRTVSDMWVSLRIKEQAVSCFEEVVEVGEALEGHVYHVSGNGQWFRPLSGLCRDPIATTHAEVALLNGPRYPMRFLEFETSFSFQPQ